MSGFLIRVPLLHEGEMVDVLVTGIDPNARRISLSIKEAMIKKQMGGGRGRP